MIRMGKLNCLLAAALSVAMAVGAQVHVERSQDGNILITDRHAGGTTIYTPEGSALNWRHKDGWLEVYDSSRKSWIRGPVDYPMVSASGNLVLGFGPGSHDSSVYDASRGAWVNEYDRYNLGVVSETLAVGFGGPGRIGIYDSRTGQWQSPNISGELVALSSRIAALYGPKSNVSIYDGQRGAWKIDTTSYGSCALGEQLVVFYGPPGTNTQVYDVEAGQFVMLRDPSDRIEIFGGVAVALGPRHKVYVYTNATAAWSEFPGQADSAEIVDGVALITDLSGDAWVYKPGENKFLKTKG